jgi:signal transduction protein with GAF and PtsI domain
MLSDSFNEGKAMDSKERSYFESFKKVLKAVGSTLSLEDVLDLLVRNVTEVMGLKACAIRLFDPTKRTLELVASHGLSRRYIEKGPVDADSSIAQTMEGKIVTILNIAGDPRAQYSQAAVEEGIVSLGSIPLSRKGRVIGVMRIYTGDPHNFSVDELNFAEALAEMGAIAIQNAQIYEGLLRFKMPDCYMGHNHSKCLHA